MFLDCQPKVATQILLLLFFPTQVLQTVDRSDTRHEHPLALLAEETKKLLKKDSTMFMPILSQRHPQATVVSASILHRLYGSKLVSKCILFFSFLFFFPVLIRSHFPNLSTIWCDLLNEFHSI